MRPDRPASLALILLVAAAVALGLWTVGGPMQGRAEARDETRYRDLLALQRQVRCLADAAGGRLPGTLEETQSCHIAERYADPYTGAPYRYERLSESGYRLCAGFETARSGDFTTGTEVKFDAEAGCLVISHPPRD